MISMTLHHTTQWQMRQITFSIMKRGGYFNSTNKEKSLVIDALSVGTLYNLKLLQAQAKTWATHRSIRHYFAATEKDDADKTCYRDSQ